MKRASASRLKRLERKKKASVPTIETVSYTHLTEGYKTPLARTTLYTYNDQFRMSLELKPNGGCLLYTSRCV